MSSGSVSARARLIVVCGLPGAGKTTHAAALTDRLPAVRLSADDWLARLGISKRDDRLRASIEALQWDLAQRLLALDVTVVIEWGTWSRSERESLRDRAVELGATVELHYLHAPTKVLHHRVMQRGAEHPPITLEELTAWVEAFEPPTLQEAEGWDVFLSIGPDGPGRADARQQ